MKKEIPYNLIENNFHEKLFLDIYSKDEQNQSPVVIFIHGGGWKSGDKKLYVPLGESLAKEGIITVIFNYRLFPEVKYPDSIFDCASAFSWVYKNIAFFGGDPNKIFIMGHSAGAHIATLLALNSKFLDSYYLSEDDIAGVIAISGIYHLNINEKSYHKSIFEKMMKDFFGTNDKILEEASPINYVKQGHPSILLLYGEKENRFIKKQSQDFYVTIKKYRGRVKIKELETLNHVTIIKDIWESEYGTADFIMDFINDIVG